MVEKSEKQSVTKDQNWGGGTPGETVSYQGPKLGGGTPGQKQSVTKDQNWGGGGDSWPETVSYQGPKLGEGGDSWPETVSYQGPKLGGGTPGETVSYQGPKLGGGGGGGGGDSWPETVSYQGPKLGGGRGLLARNSQLPRTKTRGGRGLLARNSQLPRTKTGGGRGGDSWPETVSYQGPKLGGGGRGLLARNSQLPRTKTGGGRGGDSWPETVSYQGPKLGGGGGGGGGGDSWPETVSYQGPKLGEGGGGLLARNSQLPRTKTGGGRGGTPGQKQSVTKDQNWEGGGGDSWPETVSYQGPKLGEGGGGLLARNSQLPRTKPRELLARNISVLYPTGDIYNKQPPALSGRTLLAQTRSPGFDPEWLLAFSFLSFCLVASKKSWFLARTRWSLMMVTCTLHDSTLLNLAGSQSLPLRCGWPSGALQQAGLSAPGTSSPEPHCHMERVIRQSVSQVENTHENYV